MKAKRVDAAQRALDQREPRARAVRVREAVGDQDKVRAKLFGRTIAAFRAAAFALEPRRHQPQELAVGHVAVPRGDLIKRCAKTRAVLLDAQHDLGVKGDARRRMRKVFVQVAQLFLVAAQSHFEVPRERAPHRVRADVRVAIHVAADPRRKAHERPVDAHARAVHRLDHVFELFVHGRHDAKQHVGQKEQHVLDFLADGGAAGQLFFGLPRRSDLQRDAVLDRRERAGVERVLEKALDQTRGEALLFLEHRAPHGLGRVRGKDGLDDDGVERIN